MDFNRDWTQFALDAEVDAYGTARIVKAHNALRAENRRLRAALTDLYEADIAPRDAQHGTRWHAALRKARAALEKK